MVILLLVHGYFFSSFWLFCYSLHIQSPFKTKVLILKYTSWILILKFHDTSKNFYAETEVQSTNSLVWHPECVLNRRCESYTDSSNHSMWLLYSHFAKGKMQICTAKHARSLPFKHFRLNNHWFVFRIGNNIWIRSYIIEEQLNISLWKSMKLSEKYFLQKCMSFCRSCVVFIV